LEAGNLLMASFVLKPKLKASEQQANGGKVAKRRSIPVNPKANQHGPKRLVILTRSRE
jgi:hypothetical protein